MDLMNSISGRKIRVTGQNILIRRNNKVSTDAMTKFGLYIQSSGQTDEEGLVFGDVVAVPADQNYLIDKTRPVSEKNLVAGDLVWYSGYSACKIQDTENPGLFLDIVPLEDIRAVIE